MKTTIKRLIPKSEIARKFNRCAATIKRAELPEPDAILVNGKREIPLFNEDRLDSFAKIVGGAK